jgi:hypothetical protein
MPSHVWTEIKAGLDDTWFAWSGPTTHAESKNGSAYYRIQGPNLVIEFSPQTSNGDDPYYARAHRLSRSDQQLRACIHRVRSLRRLLVALGLLAIPLAAASPVAAHRLDEYLQATTITLARDHVGLELRLTPGVSVAKVILAAIDTDQDGQLSTIEQHRYAAAVQQDLRLVIDGQSMPLTSRSVIFSCASVDP